MLAFVLPALSQSPTASANNVALAAQAQPFHDGQLTVPGLHKPVKVVRDKWGIAHIYAQNTHDLFFAQGFTAAQDHMWQMEMWRRSVEGRLSEVLGPAYVNRDKFARILAYRGDWETEERKYGDDAPMILAAFADGVNSGIRIAIHQGKIPIEFQMMGFFPADDWTPHTMLTRVPAWNLTHNASSELARALVVKTMGVAAADKLMVTAPEKKTVVPDGLDLAAISPRALELAAGTASSNYKFKPLSAGTPTPVAELELPQPTTVTDSGASLAEVLLRQVYDNTNTADLGSNNWVISGYKSATGKPILANDPHREIENPALRNFVHLVAPGYDVIGMTEPGLPGVTVGHNEEVAWGFTILGTDQQDLYIEETDPANPDRYLYKGQWLTMEHSTEIVQIKGQSAKPEIFNAKWTIHGPVIFEDPKQHCAYALKWVGSEPGGAAYMGTLNVLQAKNWADFTKGVERSWYLPSHSLVYADTQGNYGYMAATLSPIRPNWDGLLPVPGKDGKYEWAGFTPMDKLPRQLNGTRGYYASANNDVLPKIFGHSVLESGFEYSVPYRFDRIDEVLAEKKKFTIGDMEALQQDHLSIPARQLVPLLKNLTSDKPLVSDALHQLASWDDVVSQSSVAATLYEYWVLKLSPRVYALYTPEDQRNSFKRYDLRRVIQWLVAPDAAFGKKPIEARNQILLDALEDAVTMLQSRYGADQTAWQWGKLHNALFEHPLLDPTTAALLAVPAVSRGGDAYTVQATSSPTETGNAQGFGASAMMVLDTSNWDNSVGLNAPGNESTAGSKHFKDLAPLWGEGKYFPLAFSSAKVEEVAEEKQVLEPLLEPKADASGPFELVQSETFADARPIVISWADYDNDGWPDLFVAYSSGLFKLFHNDHGTFRDVTSSTGLGDYSHIVTAASWGDFDGDGNLDLYIGYAYSPTEPNRLFKGDGKGHFTEVGDKMGLHDYGDTRQVSFVDFNNDGRLDLYIAFRDRPNRLYRNDGEHFTDVTEKMGITGADNTVGSIWFDYNDDGRLDLFEANQNGKLNKVYRNDGDHFTEVAHELGLDGSPRSVELGSVSIAAADFNNDGKFDLFYANYGPSWLMRNDGKTFTDVAPEFGVSINQHVVCAGWGDYDNDGLPDLYVDGYISGHEHQEDYLFHNEGNHFSDVTPAIMLKRDADHAIAWVDYDNDGAIDLSLADHELDGRFSLYHNTLPPEQAHHSLEVMVVDMKGHATKAGSEVRLYRAGTRTVLGGRLVDTGSGYDSQSVLPVHFGLGRETGLVDVEVTWMSNSGRMITTVPNVNPMDHIGKPLIVRVGE